MHKHATRRLMTYDKYESSQNSRACRMGEHRYLANESDKIANDDGLSKKTTTHAKIKAIIGPKNLCICPKASRK